MRLNRLMIQYQFHNSRLLPYYRKVRLRQQQFEALLDQIDLQADDVVRLRMMESAAEFAVYESVGYLSCRRLEDMYLSYADKVPVVKCIPQENTTLFVLSTAYSTGGHTRVVERWIKSSHVDEKMSVILLSQGSNPIPNWLRLACENSGGQLIVLPPCDIIQRATLLRQKAASFQRIVLFTHMEDGTPIIAFGTETFSTPIFYYNHADHLFWLGVSIADVVMDIRYGNRTIKYRDVQYSSFLGIPQDCGQMGDLSATDRKRKKNICREQMGVSEDEFVLLSTGDAYKFKPLGAINFAAFLYKQYLQSPFRAFIIGANPEEPMWSDIEHKTQGKIRALGTISDREKYETVLYSADLYVGSFPFPSFTAQLDAVQKGMPFVQFQTLIQEDTTCAVDKLEQDSPCWCNSLSDLSKAISKAMNDSSFYDVLLDNSRRWAAEYANLSDWHARLDAIYRDAPLSHKIHLFESVKGRQVVINDNSVLNQHLLGSVALKQGGTISQCLTDFWIEKNI